METLSNAPPSAVTQLLRRFKDNVPITPDELPVVREIGWEIREIRRRQSILTEGSKNRAVYFVVDGFLIRYRILRDGQRQIVDLALPGDFAGVPSCFFHDALYTIKALTNATVGGGAAGKAGRAVRDASAARRQDLLVVLVRRGDPCRAPDRRRPPVGA